MRVRDCAGTSNAEDVLFRFVILYDVEFIFATVGEVFITDELLDIITDIPLES